MKDRWSSKINLKFIPHSGTFAANKIGYSP
jgi:hypothetical protein